MPLKTIQIFWNEMTQKGFTALARAIYDPTSLNSVSECNHTCWIDGLHKYLPDDGYEMCNNAASYQGAPYRPVKQTRARKIYQLLSKRNKEGSNVQHLNLEFEDDDDEGGLALKIVPKVFEAVHNYSNESNSLPIPPLSIMYEVLRGWKMPELFEKRS